MNANFLETVLPTQGMYCVVGIDENKTIQRFAETLDSLKEQATKLIEKELNVYFALGTFEGHSRKADECIYMKSFFIDLDCGEGKHYATKTESIKALAEWVEKTGFKKPMLVDSGGGTHAYWPFTEDVPSEKWKLYAGVFKKYCMDTGLNIDPSVTADAARILRYPGSYNYRKDAECKILTPIVEYAFDDLVEPLGPIQTNKPEVLKNETDGSIKTINKFENYEFDFDLIKDKSLKGSGCAHIAKAIQEPENCGYPLWRSTLSVAIRCIDGDRIIHEISKGHPKYSAEETEKIARGTFEVKGSHTCAQFDKGTPGVCESCPRFGVINSPISLGKNVRTAESVKTSVGDEEVTGAEPQPIRNKSSTKEVPIFPEYLKPFVRGINGGIYYQTPPEFDRKTKKWIEQDPVCLLTEDLYATKRMFSQQDGEILQMRLHTPRDGIRDFLIPMKHVYALDKFKETMSGHGVFVNTKHLNILMDYTIRWGKYLLNTERAEVMRIQMGWSDDMKSFIAGTQEIMLDEIYDCPPSPLSKSLALNIRPEGSYEVWQRSANKLNIMSLEIHAFTMLCGFGSILMPHAINAGSAIVLHGQLSGVGKTGALYSALSPWGNPKEMSVMENTDNGFTTRVVNLKNIPLGLDEQTNIKGEILSQYLYILNNGKPKIRMMSSTNAERLVPMSAALIAIFTSNSNLIDTIREYRTTPHGEQARLLSFHIGKTPDAFMGRGQEIGNQIFHPFNDNYGHAGPMFVQQVLKAGQGTVKTYLEYWERRFRTDFSQNSQYRFYTATVACAFTAGEMLNKAGILNLDLERIYMEVLRSLQDESVSDGVNETDYEDILGTFINEHIASTLIVGENNKLISAPRNALIIRIETYNNAMYISKSAFREYLTKKKMQVRDFENAMVKSNILTDRSYKVRMGTGYQPGSQPTYNYKFETNVSQFVEHALNSNRESST